MNFVELIARRGIDRLQKELLEGSARVLTRPGEAAPKRNKTGAGCSCSYI